MALWRQKANCNPPRNTGGVVANSPERHLVDLCFEPSRRKVQIYLVVSVGGDGVVPHQIARARRNGREHVGGSADVFAIM